MLISLKVATVRQAQQILSIGTIAFVFGTVFVLKAIPANVFSSLTYAQVLLITMAFIALLDAILLGLSLASFQRSRLILSYFVSFVIQLRHEKEPSAESLTRTFTRIGDLPGTIYPAVPTTHQPRQHGALPDRIAHRLTP